MVGSARHPRQAKGKGHKPNIFPTELIVKELETHNLTNETCKANQKLYMPTAVCSSLPTFAAPRTFTAKYFFVIWLRALPIADRIGAEVVDDQACMFSESRQTAQ